jgi:endoglucanase
VLLLNHAASGGDVISDQVAASRVVVGFEDTAHLKFEKRGLNHRVVTVGDGKALEISGAAGRGYPAVALKSTPGPWDLGEYDVVLMDVENLADTPVRVLLSLNNPGADGRRHCNTESVAVPPRGRGVLRVPYGMWHGSSGRWIDRSAIESVVVLMDNPADSYRFRVDNIRTVRYARTRMTDLYSSAFYRDLKPFFGRGINLGNALEAPEEGRWGVTLQDDYFPIIKQAGFDSVRIPVRWSAHAETVPPYRIDPLFMKRVNWAVNSALQQGLNVVLNMHHYDEFFEDPAGHRDRFIALWKQIAVHFRSTPDAVCFELLNEPHDKLVPIEWNHVAAQTVTEVRKSNPDRWIMIGPGHYNSIGRLNELELPEDDRRIVVTVHYYQPFRFTHQGASWTGPAMKKLKGVRWRGSEAERDAVRRDLDTAIAWAIMHKRPIFLGEFGAYSPAAMGDRALWTECVAREAAARKMGTAYWEFCAGFGAYDPGAGHWRQPLLDALIWE